MNKTSMIVVSLLALSTTACVSEMRVHEQIGPISGHLIRTIEGPTDEGGGVRVSGIQTFSRGGAVAGSGSAYCSSSTRTVRRKLCDGRVVTRRVTTLPATTYQSGWTIQDSQFFAGPGMAQTALGAAINAAGVAGGMYLGRPPKISGDNVTVTQQGGGATSTSAGGQGGQASATGTGGAGGRGGTGGAGGVGGAGIGVGVGGSAVASATTASTNTATASTKSLNRQSQEFHAKNPLHPVEHKPVYHKPVEHYSSFSLTNNPYKTNQHDKPKQDHKPDRHDDKRKSY